jgi:hypothetical protein
MQISISEISATLRLSSKPLPPLADRFPDVRD